MTNQIIGKWVMTESDNFDDFLKEIGFKGIIRMMAGRIKPTMAYEVQNDGKITETTMLVNFITISTTFELGVEFEEDVPLEDNVKSKNVITMEGNKMIHKMRVHGVDAVVIREFNGDEMVATHTAGAQVAVRKFKKTD